MSTNQKDRVQPFDQSVSSKHELAGAGTHRVHLPSGGTAKIRIPDLHQLVAYDLVPDRLRIIALQRVLETMDGGQPETLTQETLDIAEGVAKGSADEIARAQDKVRRAVELNTWLVSKMLVEPAFTPDELGPDSHSRLSDEDLIFLVQIALRGRNTDAAGVRLGVAQIDDWATFRNEHECPEDCPRCYSSLLKLSTTGPVRL